MSVIEIRDIRPQDFAQAVRFAEQGMHLDLYVGRGPLLHLYAWYFWYEELLRATQALGAFVDGRLVGVLMAAFDDEPPVYGSLAAAGLVRFGRLLEGGVLGPADPYGAANGAMLEDAQAKAPFDGEICFLAADPNSGVKGVGTALLRELERREPGRRVYLYTDSQCTYQFYDHRGFERVGERSVQVDVGPRSVPLDCFLYAKELPSLVVTCEGDWRCS